MSAIAGALGLLATIAAIVLWVPTTVLLIEILAAWPTRATRAQIESASPRPPLAVLMPAHDEALGIGAAIASVLRQLAPGDRLLVVADNCTDSTAQVAAAAGAEVVERNDPLRRGKGYALDHGVRHLAARPPAIVIVVDADCEAHPGSLDRLTRACAIAARPIQALYLMRSPPDAVLRTRLAELAWTVKNHVRPLGGLRLGAPCQLMGTGMAFTWSVIATAPLASGHIVEDMQLGLDLARAGTPPLFCPDALVTSVFPASDEGTTAQRTRWEHGHLGVIFRHGVPTLCRAIAQRRLALLLMVLDLCVPPPTILATLLLLQIFASAANYFLGGWSMPFWLSVAALVIEVGAIGLAWSRFGRRLVTFREMLGAPLYLVGKLPLYARFFKRGEHDWIRTRR